MPNPEMMTLSMEMRKIKTKITSFRIWATFWSLRRLMLRPPITTKRTPTMSCGEIQLDTDEEGTTRSVGGLLHSRRGVECGNEEVQEGDEQSQDRADAIEQVCGPVVLAEVQPTVTHQGAR